MTKKYKYSLLDASSTPACVETQEKEGDWHQLCEDIVKFDWSPIVFRENYRKSENFQSSELVVLDFDDSDHKKIVEQVESMGVQYFTSFTKSHMSGEKGSGDYFRLVIPLEKKITDVDVYKKHMHNIIAQFKGADKKCKDAARFYFRSSKAGLTKEGDYLKIYKEDDRERRQVNTSKDLEGFEAIKNKLKKDFFKGINVIPLTYDALSFLLNAERAAHDCSFNDSIFKAAKDLFRAGLDREQVELLLDRVSPEPLDHKDKNAISSAEKSAQKLGKLKELKDLAERKNKTSFLDSIIDAHCSKYLKLLNESGEFVRVVTFDENEVLEEVSEDSLQSSINKLIKNTAGMRYSAKKIRDISDTIKLNLDDMYMDKILPVKFKDQYGYSWSQLDFLPSEGPTPIFDQLTNGWANQQALYAFIGSLFYPESNKSQYCYVYGQGGEGKSTLSNFLFKIFRNSAISIKASDGYANRFHGSNLVGKRLAIFPDPNSPNYVTSEFFKNVTGDEPVSIERKYCDPVTVKLSAKFMLTSNVLPNISTNFADRRRLIFVETSKVDKPIYDIGTKLWGERSAIIYKCIQVYKQLCKDGNEPIPCEVPRQLIENKNMRFITFFDANFEIDSESEVTIKQVYNKIGGQFSGNRERFFDDFLKFIKNFHGLNERLGVIEGLKIK